MAKARPPVNILRPPQAGASLTLELMLLKERWSATHGEEAYIHGLRLPAVGSSDNDIGDPKRGRYSHTVDWLWWYGSDGRCEEQLP